MNVEEVGVLGVLGPGCVSGGVEGPTDWGSAPKKHVSQR